MGSGHVINHSHSVLRCQQTLLHALLCLNVFVAHTSAWLQIFGEIAEYEWSMCKNYGMPVSKVEYVSLSLKDRTRTGLAVLFDV